MEQMTVTMIICLYEQKRIENSYTKAKAAKALRNNKIRIFFPVNFIERKGKHTPLPEHTKVVTN